MYRKTRISVDTIQDLLIDLSFNCPYLGTKFIVFCKNEEHEMTHPFEFTTRKELKEFLLLNSSNCSECGAPLDVNNIRVNFYKKQEMLKAL
ncbi:hypothetical protein ABET51_02905 [Metabacillus fastidiosus]|uniref:hypothetical protein n=1 Tax=Metabacillus fastidiosus TaxID=1458 RepID=UPI003D2A0ED0